MVYIDLGERQGELGIDDFSKNGTFSAILVKILLNPDLSIETSSGGGGAKRSIAPDLGAGGDLSDRGQSFGTVPSVRTKCTDRSFGRIFKMNSYTFANDVNAQRTLAYASDEVLVEITKAGEKLAFVELWRRHSAKIFKTVFRVTRNREDAEDALQDAFLKAFVHLKGFDGRSKFSTWLTRIAINSALMILRRKRSYPETSMDITAQGEAHQCREFEDHSVDIEAHCVRTERARHLKRAICRLRPALREVVEIQQLHDVSVKEVAEITGLSLAATKSRMMRAKAALRRKLH